MRRAGRVLRLVPPARLGFAARRRPGCWVRGEKKSQLGARSPIIPTVCCAPQHLPFGPPGGVGPRNPPTPRLPTPCCSRARSPCASRKHPKAPRSSASRGLPHAVPPPSPEGQLPVGAPRGSQPGRGEPFPQGLCARQQLSPSPRRAGGSWGCNRMSDRSRSENLLHAGISRFASSSCPPWKPRRGGGRWQRGEGNYSLASRAPGAGEAAACCCCQHRHPRASPFTPRRRHFPVSAPHLSAERKSHLMQTKVV